jgi:hypothetical protein
MKKPIVIAVVSVSIMVASRIIMGGLALLSGQLSPVDVLVDIMLPVLLAVLILVGIIKGHHLAWQWGRLLGLAAAILLTVIAVVTFAHSGEQPEMMIVAVFVAVQGIPLFPMFFALGTNGAREHFRLICPSCGSSRVKGANFLFTKAICRRCNATWS